jgi:hypothetical protein
MRQGVRLVIDTRPIELASPAAIALPAGTGAIATKDALLRLSMASSGGRPTSSSSDRTTPGR